MRLIVKSGVAAGREYGIDRELVAGRAPTSDIVLPDGGVSSRHASFRPAAAGIEVTDLGSLNGTFVGGVKIDAPTVVLPGAELRLSTTVIEVAPSVPLGERAVSAGAPVPRLVVRTGPDLGREAPLPEGREIVIGRGPGSGLQLSDPRVSDRNTRVWLANGIIDVADLGSANGTMVDGQIIEGPVRVSEGSEIQVGDTVISYVVRAGFDVNAGPSPTLIGRVRPTAAGVSDSMIARRIEEAVAAKATGQGRRTSLLLGMVAVLAVIAVGVGGWAFLSGGDAKSADDQVAAVVKAQTPATVRIDIVDDKGEVVAGGSGSIVDLDGGYVLTNNHVIVDGKARVFSAITKTPIDAELVGTAVCDDLALLRVKDLKKRFPELKQVQFVDPAKLNQGETVVALGYPVSAEKFGQESLSATRGVISKTKTVSENDPGSPHFPNVVQTDTAINHGNSGGPMFDLRGKQIGVNTFGLNGAESTNYAISAARVLEVLPTLKAGKSPRWIGARFGAVSLSGGGTALVVGDLYPGGTAEKAGLLAPVYTADGQKPRMVISKINGKEVKQVDDYCKMMPESGDATLTVSEITNGKFGAGKDVKVQVDAK